MRAGRKRLVVIAGVVASTLAIGGAAAGYLFLGSRTAQAAPPQYVGRVSNSNAFIGFTKDGRRIQAYVCDGTQGHISIHEWFNGLAFGDTFDLTSKGSMRVTGVLAGDSISGRFTTVDRKEYGYTASLATGDAGLIRIEGIHYGKNWVAGWIQLPDGEQRGPAIAYVYDCGCYAARKWCRNAYGVWHDFGPGSC
ncbi:MAG: hypothetical protein WAQ33_01145 [Gaiellaceae bacterium]